MKKNAPIPAGIAPPLPVQRKKGRPRTRPAEAEDPDSDGGSSGIRAMVVGLSVLRSLGSARRPQPLREIAAANALAPSRVHRYLSSLVAAGFVQQDARSGDYWLGEVVVEIGLQALGQLDSIGVGIEALQACCERSGLDGHLSVWGSHGPTVVRWESGRLGHQFKIVEGRVLPLLWSATGRLMAAYRGIADVAPLLEPEMSAWNTEHAKRRIDLNQIQKMYAAVRARGFSSAAPVATTRRGPLLDPVFPRLDHFGLETVAVPIFDHQGCVPLALTFFGTNQFRLLGNGSERISEIIEAARVASKKLGYAATA